MTSRNQLGVGPSEQLEQRSMLAATQLSLEGGSPFDAVTYDSANGELTFELASPNGQVAKVDRVEINGTGQVLSLSQLGREGGSRSVNVGELDLSSPTQFAFTSEPDGGETLFDLATQPITGGQTPAGPNSDATAITVPSSTVPSSTVPSSTVPGVELGAASGLLPQGSSLPQPSFEVNNQNTLAFSTNQTINDFNVPNDIDLIKISDNTTLQGRFIVGNGRANPLIIKGEGDGSVIEGVSGKSRSDYGGVGGGVAIDATGSNQPIYLLDFKSQDPHGYHMRAISQPVYASNVSLIESDSNNFRGNTDGFSGGGGSVYENSFVDTMDDSFKFYYGDYTLKNIQIVHNKNGAPFQFGWGDMDADALNIEMDGVTVQGNSSGNYNQGVFSWAGSNAEPTAGNRTRNIILEGAGLQVSTNPQKVTAPLYRFGDNVNNKTLRISGVGATEFAPSNQNVRNEGGSNNNVSIV